MKTFLLCCALLMLAGCERTMEPPQVSPSGKFAVRTEISGDEAGPRLRLCVKLIFLDKATNHEVVFQTRASDVQKWAIAWSPANSLILYSSDIGTYAYDIKDGEVTEREANENEQEIGRQAYKTAYGKLPGN